MHRDSLNDAIVTPDNNYIITVGDDKLVKVWDHDYKVKNP
jgi:WD40 repeat protein